MYTNNAVLWRPTGCGIVLREEWLHERNAGIYNSKKKKLTDRADAPKPPLCKGRWHGVSRDGGIVLQYKHNQKIVPIAKTLRKNMTKEERHLWYDFLRQYPIRFSRQKVLGKYIADFYCPQAKLVLELDGSQHYEKDGMQKDKARTEFLQGYDITVLRIPNNEVNRNFFGVCEYIDAAVKQSLSQLR